MKPNVYFCEMSMYMPPYSSIYINKAFSEVRHFVRVCHITITEKPEWYKSCKKRYAEDVGKYIPTMLGLNVYHCVNGMVYCTVLSQAIPIPNAIPYYYFMCMDEFEWSRVQYFCPELGIK